MALLFWSHAYFNTLTVSTTKEHTERVCRFKQSADNKKQPQVREAIVDGLTIHFCKDKTILKFHDGNSSIQMVFPKEQHLYPVHNELPYALIAPIQTKN